MSKHHSVLELPRRDEKALKDGESENTHDVINMMMPMREVMKDLLPIEITNWLIDNDAMYILNVISKNNHTLVRKNQLFS